MTAPLIILPPGWVEHVAQLRRSMDAFTASTAPLVRQVEAFAVSMAPGPVAHDLWLVYRPRSGDDDTREQAADRMRVRFGKFIHEKAYARMAFELTRQARTHRRSVEQELATRVKTAMFMTVHELSGCSPWQTAEALHVWRNRVQAEVLTDLLGDHPRRSSEPLPAEGTVPPRQETPELDVWSAAHGHRPGREGGLECDLWLQIEHRLAASRRRLTAQDEVLIKALCRHQGNLLEVARTSGRSYAAVKKAAERLHRKLA